MFLTPSKILYTHHDPEICSFTERSFNEMKKYVHGSTVFPKLQVVKKDGFYFTLNDAKLQVYRQLEKLGRCGRVEVEKVSLKEVPEGIRKLMTAPDFNPRYKAGQREKRRRGKYQSISTELQNEVDVDDSLVLSKNSIDNSIEESDEESEYSDSDESDVFSSDWSNEEPSATDIDSSEDDTDEEKSSETTQNRTLHIGANKEETESFI